MCANDQRKTTVASDGRLPLFVDWSAGREANEGKPRYQLDLRTMGKKRWGKYKTQVAKLSRTGTNRFLDPGTYQYRVRTNPATGEPGPWVEAPPFRVTVLQESDQAIEYRGSWSKQSRNGAMGGQVRRTVRPGDSFQVPVDADAVSIVMTAGPDQGVIDVCLDPDAPTPGACRTVDLSVLRKGTRRVVTNLRNLPDGQHTLQVSVRQAPIELDALVLMTDVPEEVVAPPASQAPATSPAPGG